MCWGDMACAQKSLQLLSGDNLMFIPLIQHLELIILVLLLMRLSGIVCGGVGSDGFIHTRRGRCKEQEALLSWLWEFDTLFCDYYLSSCFRLKDEVVMGRHEVDLHRLQNESGLTQLY